MTLCNPVHVNDVSGECTAAMFRIIQTKITYFRNYYSKESLLFFLETMGKLKEQSVCKMQGYSMLKISGILVYSNHFKKHFCIIITMKSKG